jgi:hypothetical protein
MYMEWDLGLGILIYYVYTLLYMVSSDAVKPTRVACKFVTPKMIPTAAGANSTAPSRGAMRRIASRRMVQLAASLAALGTSFETLRFARLLRTRAALDLLSSLQFARKPLISPHSGKRVEIL